MGAWIKEHHDPYEYGGTRYSYGYRSLGGEKIVVHADEIACTNFEEAVEHLIESMEEQNLAMSYEPRSGELRTWQGEFTYLPVSTHADPRVRTLNAYQIMEGA